MQRMKMKKTTPPSSEGSGAGHVLPPDNLYQEPNEVPIPHHSKRERPDS